MRQCLRRSSFSNLVTCRKDTIRFLSTCQIRSQRQEPFEIKHNRNEAENDIGYLSRSHLYRHSQVAPIRRTSKLQQGRSTSKTSTSYQQFAGNAESRSNQPTAQRQASQVDVVLDGIPLKFSTVLLRDLCECPGCLDSSTKQKLFSTTDIPLEIQARSVAQTSGGVSIQWEHDIPGYPIEHITEISTVTLRNLTNIGFLRPPFKPGQRKLWGAKMYSKLPDLDYEAYMQDDSVLYMALRQLHVYGLMFLTNVPESEKSVSTIGERIGPLKNTFYGYTWDVRSVPEAKNVAYTSQDLGFHMDLLYMEQPPHLQLLHCIRSSAAGGASLFSDSYRAAQELSEADIHSFETLARVKASFHYDHPTSHLYSQSRSVFELKALVFNGVRYRGMRQLLRGHAKARFIGSAASSQNETPRITDFLGAVSWSPPFQGPMSLGMDSGPLNNGSEATLNRLNVKVDAWHASAQAFSKLVHRPEGIYERLMKPGECVVFDNRRVLHARKAFEVGDAGTERWLRGAYLDQDPYLSKLQVLSRHFGRAAAEDNALAPGVEGPFESSADV